MLWRTEKGLAGVDFLAQKLRKIWTFLSSLGVLISFPIMFFVLYSLAESALLILTLPDAPPGLAPAIPGVRVPGSPIFIPFWYGVLALVTVLVAHEVMHAIISRSEGLNVKSMGILFLTFIPLGAFAEPDEEELEDSPLKTKIRVYAAGSFGNFMLAILVVFLTSSLFMPVMFHQNQINISHIYPNTPAMAYGVKANTTLVSLNGVKIRSLDQFFSIARNIKAGDKVTLVTTAGKVELISEKRPDQKPPLLDRLLGRKHTEDRGYIGIGVLPVYDVKPSAVRVLGESNPWRIIKLLNWIFLLNLFIGITNLLPISPLDGGRIIESIAKSVSAKRADKITHLLYLFVLLLIFINISPFFRTIL